MRLPIQSMQAVRLRPSETDHWYRSVIVDFDLGRELVVILPKEKDREQEGPQDSSRDVSADDGLVGDGDRPTTADAINAPDAENVVSATAHGAPTSGDPGDVLVDDDEFLPPSPFARGARLDVEIYFPDGIRAFNSIVRRQDLTYGGSLRIEWPTDGTRVQRRDYVRVESTSRTLVWFREEEGESLQKVDGFTMDFSAGGVRLKLLEPLPADLRIEMEIGIPALNGRLLQGRVVRSGLLEKKRKEAKSYWVAVEFVGVDEALRKELTQLVFDIQREQMRQSLG